MKIDQIMTKKVYTISPNSSLKECSKIIEKKRVNGLVVMEGEKVVGVITKTDIFKVILPRYPESVEEEQYMSELEHIEERIGKLFEMKVKDIMGSPPITVNSGAPSIRAGSIMLLRRVKQIPVVNEGKLIGIVTLTDIINNFLRRLQSQKGALSKK
jgi:CBS domain-containing protein